MAQRYFAVTSPGLEEVLLDELKEFKIKKPKVLQGGVEFQATGRGFYQVLRGSRIAHRLYLRVDDFRARDAYELYRKSRRFEWERLLIGGMPQRVVELRGVAHRSRLGGSGEVVDRVADGIYDRFVEELFVHPPKLMRDERYDGEGRTHSLMVRLIEDRCELNLEAAGRAMHQRGWREETGRAPIRESLAAAMLRMSGWAPGEPLFDPMCGSGTFVIEAARQVAGLEPRAWTEYMALDFANANQELFDEVGDGLFSAHASSGEDHEVLLYGKDRSPRVLPGANRNAARAAVERLVSITEGEVANMLPPTETPGLVICNPPYGERLTREGALGELLAQFALHFDGWKLGVVLPRDFDLREGAVPMREVVRFKNGGMPVTFWLHDPTPPAT